MEPIANLAAEAHVIGAMLISDKAADRGFEALHSDHFYKLQHGLLFTAMEKMVALGLPLDGVAVSAFVKEQGIAVDAEVIEELALLVPTTSNVAHHAKLVRDCWVKRTLQASLLTLGTRLEELPADEAVAAYEESSIRLADQVADKHESIVDLATVIDEFERRMKSPSTYENGVPFAYPWFNEEPLKGGRLYVLGGYQADGKTAAMMQFAAAACEAGKHVGIASLEMSQQDLFDRWVSNRTGVSYKALRRGDVYPEDVAKVDTALEMMRGWRCHIIDDEQVTPAKLRRIQRGKKFDLLIIDHLHQMEWEDRKHLEQNVKQITGLSRHFDIPVLLLAQLTRAGDWKNPFPIPTMRSLRESGMIEALASHVWFVYRDRDEQHDIGKKGRFIVAKNRYGSTYSRAMYFDSNIIGFSETDPDEYEVVEEETREEVPF